MLPSETLLAIVVEEKLNNPVLEERSAENDHAPAVFSKPLRAAIPLPVTETPPKAVSSNDVMLFNQKLAKPPVVDQTIDEAANGSYENEM